MQKAMKLFLSKGFEGTSTNDICMAAKLTKPSLYHYFQSKNHLLFSIHMLVIEETLHPQMEEVAAIQEPVKRLEMIVRGHTRIICTYPELRFILHGSLTVRDRYYARIRQEWKKFYVLLRDTIAELQSMGRMNRALKPSWAALQILGMITWMTYWFDYKRKNQIDKIADSMVEMTLHGIGLDRPG